MKQRVTPFLLRGKWGRKRGEMQKEGVEEREKQRTKEMERRRMKGRRTRECNDLMQFMYLLLPNLVKSHGWGV
jgi:hypothetical protein